MFGAAAIVLSKSTLIQGLGYYGTSFVTKIGTSLSLILEAVLDIPSNASTESLRPAIDLVRIPFTGTLRYKNGDHLYLDLGPKGIRYFGVPSSEVDNAWEELIG